MVKLVNKKKFLKNLKKITTFEKITIYSFKKDRKITVLHEQPDNYQLIEDGFRLTNMTFSNEKELIKELKKVFQIEFPNSYKLYVSYVKRQDTDGK